MSDFCRGLAVFGAVCYGKGKFLEKGEIRSSIAIALTALYIILVPLSLVRVEYLDFRGEFLKNFWIAYTSILAFYFGTRTIESWLKVKYAPGQNAASKDET